MKRSLAFSILAAAVLSSSPAVSTFVPVISAQQQPLPKGQMPDLGRPTKVGDELPTLNADEYFLGKWTFEWDVPEGPLGPSGTITGTTIYKTIEPGKFFQADTDAKGPAGAFKIHELIAYQRDSKTMSRYVTDSRGFAFLQPATIGGDLGGIYNIFFESSPFTVNGKTIRIKHTLRLMSPMNYRVATSVSVDGGRFMNYGNPWWRKSP
jgi:hypothetical protein